VWRLALPLLWCAAAFANADEPPPAAAWLLVRDTQVVSEHRADEPLPVASLGKLLTAVVWLQQPERLAQPVTVSARAAAATGARAGLRAGEQYTGADLLNALLVRSANDACLALAEQAAGSVEAFVADLNRAATTLELTATRFENPCGWDAPAQRSSARELLAIARIAMEYPEIRERVALPEFLLKSRAGREVGTLRNTNLLLGRVPGTRGVKTGYTARAGKCLIALTERGDHAVWLVLLGAEERWWTAQRAIEEALRDAPAP
jgi:D-alanyl-D-alanine carboxypeptidase (penicillin-binding protein 5/6)